MRHEVKIHGLKVCCLLACVVATAVASAAVCKVTMHPGEHWWGVCNSFGTNMPFTVETREFKADLFAWNYSDKPKTCALEIDGRVGSVHRGEIEGTVLRIAPNDAAVFEVTGGKDLCSDD